MRNNTEDTSKRRDPKNRESKIKTERFVRRIGINMDMENNTHMKMDMKRRMKMIINKKTRIKSRKKIKIKRSTNMIMIFRRRR